MSDHRYQGYLYNLREPRYPVTGPIGLKEVTKTYPLKSSLVKGMPVLPPQPGSGFLHGSPTIGKFTETDRKEQRNNIRLLEKTSAEFRKLQRQQLERQQFTEEHRQVKDAQEKQKKQEKQDDLKLLKNYNPFGKPGFGAPRGSDKPNLIMTKSLQAKDGVGIVREETKRDLPRQLPPDKRPRIQRYEDDRMRRYRVDKKTAHKYKTELDALIDVKKQQAKLLDGIDKKREEQMVDYDPFGKPGAGAPNIDDSGNIMMFRKHRFASPEKVPEKAKANDDNPWLKLGQPTKREKLRFPRAGDHGIYEFVDPEIENEGFSRKHVGGGGEPLVDKSGEIRTKRAGLLTTIHGARRTENITKVATPENVRETGKLSPWGRPGAGAPLKDSEGEIVKNTKGRIQYESLGYSKREEENMGLAKKLYRDDLQKGIEQQRQIRDEEKGYMRLPPGDVPSWFSKGKVGRPKRDPVTGIIVPQKRIMSDVTAQKFNIDRPRDAEKYYQDLQRMAGERYKKRMEEKQRLIQQDIKPFPYRVVAPWAIDA
uniref:Uncharacterized protein LOC100181873 n=1 Tax=Phallusia mammillata TaxID=59560 RepID=A0A6F9DI33_9ASCI|nr:uncharacterized protein LOC100181873 [Phallusia mammillata]